MAKISCPSLHHLQAVQNAPLSETPFTNTIRKQHPIKSTLHRQILYRETRRNPLQPDPIILIKRSLGRRIQIKHPDNPASLVPQRNDDLRLCQLVTRYGNPVMSEETASGGPENVPMCPGYAWTSVTTTVSPLTNASAQTPLPALGVIC